MAAARPSPNTLSTRSGSLITNEPNTQIMMAAAAVMTRAVLASPSATAQVLSPRPPPLLPDPRQQEHLVVHRQPEQDGEHHERDPRVDRARCGRSPKNDPSQPHWNTATITP